MRNFINLIEDMQAVSSGAQDNSNTAPVVQFEIMVSATSARKIRALLETDFTHNVLYHQTGIMTKKFAFFCRDAQTAERLKAAVAQYVLN